MWNHGVHHWHIKSCRGAPLAHANNSIVLEGCRYFRPNAGKFWIKWANSVHREKTPLFRSLIIADECGFHEPSLPVLVYIQSFHEPLHQQVPVPSQCPPVPSVFLPVHRTFFKGFKRRSNASRTVLLGPRFGRPALAEPRTWSQI